MTASRVTYMTVDEAAKILRISPSTVLRRCRSGDIPATKPLGTWLISADRLTELLDAGSNWIAEEPVEEDASA